MVYSALFAPVGKADIVEGDGPSDAVERACIGGIGQFVRRRQSAHPVLHLTDRAIDAHQRETDPAGHLRDTDGDGACGGNVAGRRAALRPEQKRAADQDQRQHPGDGHQGDAEPGRQHPEIERGIAKARHGAERRLILMRRMGEQLHRLDIGDRVDDLPRHHRPRPGPRGGPAPDARQEGADQRQIGHKPDRQRHRHPAVHRQEKRHGADDGGQREGNGVDGFAGDIGHGAGRLHLLLRDPAREIVVEEGHRLAQRPAMQARKDKGQDVRLHDDGIRRRRKPEGERAQHDEEDREAKVERPVLHQNGGRVGALRGIDHATEEPGGDNLHRTRDAGKDGRRQQRRPGARQAPEEEPPQRPGRRSVRRAEGVDQVGELHCAASGLSSVPMKPPDCLSQNWA